MRRTGILRLWLLSLASLDDPHIRSTVTHTPQKKHTSVEEYVAANFYAYRERHTTRTSSVYRHQHTIKFLMPSTGKIAIEELAIFLCLLKHRFHAAVVLLLRDLRFAATFFLTPA